MPLSDRERATFEVLTRQLDVEWDRPRSYPHARRRAALVATTIAGVVALPVAIATDLAWIGLVGFLVAACASERLLGQLPRPHRGWFRDRGLLPTVADVDRRSYDGTMVTRRTLILPGRLIIILVALVAAILLPLASTAAITQPDRTTSISE